MAGIFGLLGSRLDSELPGMASRLGHRGWTVDFQIPGRGVSLGGVSDRASSCVVGQDGCVLVGDLTLYNVSELHASLKQVDQDHPDDAGRLVLALYRTVGAEAFAMLNGEFALALWDDGKRELILARDFVGARPLYYALLPAGGLAFASEYKALLAIDEIAAEPDLDMLQWLQHTKHLPSERTLLRAVRAVLPGTALAFDCLGQTRWHSRMPPLELAVERMPMHVAQRAVTTAFMQAMETRIGCHASVGIALSGGIDSMGVACAARQLCPDAQIHTFTAGSARDDPEIIRAEFVADRIGATQHNVIVTPADISALLPQVVWHLENPIARSETVQFYALGQAASGIVEMVLTGVAADGLFAGMPRHKILWLIHQLPSLRVPLTEFYSLTQAGRPPETILGSLMDRLYFRGNLPAVPAVNGSSYRPALPQLPPNSREFLNQMLCAGFQESVASWLPKLERTLRAGRLSFTSPFLDRDLMRVAFTIPSAYKIHRGREKYVLRQSMRSIVPPEVLRAPKIPMKMKHDLAFSEVLDALADRLLSRERVERRGLFDFGTVKQLRRRRPGLPYNSEGAMRLWTALLTEIWAHQFLDLRGERPARLEELSAGSSRGPEQLGQSSHETGGPAAARALI